MHQTIRHSLTLLVICLLLFPPVSAQTRRRPSNRNPPSGWPAYGRDAGGARYSPLSQINPGNVSRLKVAWSYRTGEAASTSSLRQKAAFEATPILLDGTLYLSTPYNRVIALDPATGVEKWVYDPQINLSKRYSEITSRGVAAWSGGKSGKRIFFGTIDARLIALDAATGRPCADFGERGEVDLKVGIRLLKLGSYLNYQVTSPPVVIGDTVIVGSSIGDNVDVGVERGVVRAFDARNGRLRWSWDPIPQESGDPAGGSWPGESARRTGAANAWSIMSVDAGRDLVFVPTSSPSPDFYGGGRLGANSYANSVVALRGSTGKVVWSFQVVHHDLWDYDVAAQPALIELRRGGATVPAIVVATKMGHLFVLNRETGKPLFPVEERRVPASDVPGEESSPTQPFPQKLPALVPQKLTPDDAWGFTDGDRKWCRERISSLRSEGIFTPPSLGGTVMFPGNVGGVNWGGVAYDAKEGLLFAATNRLATVVKLIPRAQFDQARTEGEGSRLGGEFGSQTGAPYGMYREPLLSPQRVPCNAPPWGTLSAVDLKNGLLKWEVPLGTIPALSKVPQSAG
ncbi:MAG TPA: pyrroloquinoline quinone-dependent dehydrogenase, partial [Pyrinomonadaceae bacterium]|nr:pyrroloquinoline quinone-dependent dehydrogenase [Pyrinomonadaceae bacterium]